MNHGRADRVSLAAGVASMLLGCAFCLDQLDLISLSMGLTAAALCAAAGFVLVVAGLGPEGDEGRDGG
jgi:hypothetical protein